MLGSTLESYKKAFAKLRSDAIPNRWPATTNGRAPHKPFLLLVWSHSHNDDPRNGIALCGLHHWSFDQGLITVTPAYHIAISTTVPNDDDATKPLRELGGRTIQVPTDDFLRPAREALRWHNKNIFRTDTLRRLF